MCADDDLNYKDPGDYLAAAKASTGKMTKILNKLAKAESEISGEISKISKEVSEASAEYDKISKAISNVSKEVDDAASAGRKAAGKAFNDGLSAASSEINKL